MSLHPFEQSGRALLHTGDLLFPGELAFGAVQQTGEIFDILPRRSGSFILRIDLLQLRLNGQNGFLAAFDIADEGREFQNDLPLLGFRFLGRLQIFDRGHSGNVFENNTEAKRGVFSISLFVKMSFIIVNFAAWPRLIWMIMPAMAPKAVRR